MKKRKELEKWCVKKELNLSYIVSTGDFKKTEDIFVVLIGLEDLEAKIHEVDFVGLTGEEKGIVKTVAQKVLENYASTHNIPLIPYHEAYHKTEKDYRATNALVSIGTEQQLDNVNALGVGIPSSKYILEVC